MEKRIYQIPIHGDEVSARQKAEAIAQLAAYLDVQTLKALAHVAKNDPQKVKLAKSFLGVA